MIKAILGNIGSGKSVYATKLVRESKYHCFVNFNIKSPNATRLRKEHIVLREQVGETARGKPIYEDKVNWDYWNEQLDEHENYHLFLDEIHNLIHSRRSTSKWNTLATMWISQIRKILGDKEDTHIYMISQRLPRIDVAFRDLIHVIIACEKFATEKTYRTAVISNGKIVYKRLPLIMIVQYHFLGDNCREKYYMWMSTRKRTYSFKTFFVANQYLKFYDSYEIFGETSYV